MSARLLFIYAGGTLGMRLTGRGWEPGADLEGWLGRLMATHLPEVAWDLVTLEPLIDSSNATPRDWQRIVAAIRSRADDRGPVVVLHGTDTLAFTAAGLHYALAAVPVVLTGAQRSLVTGDSDAAGNVLGAVRCALDPALDRVVVVFDGAVIDGDRVTKVSSTDDHAFGSVNGNGPSGEPERGGGGDTSHTIEGLGRSKHLRRPGRVRSGPPSTGARPRAGEPRPYADVDVVVLTLHPGLRAQRLAAQLTPPPQAAILRAYGTGNAPDNDPALLAALARASEAGTVVVVTTQCPHGGVTLGQYAVSQGLLATGAISGGDLGVEALVAWATFLLSQGMAAAEVRAAMGGASALVGSSSRRRSPGER